MSHIEDSTLSIAAGTQGKMGKGGSEQGQRQEATERAHEMLCL